MLTVSTRAVNVLNKSGIELFEGIAAWQQLSNDSFLSGWDKLYEDCPWGTVFQSRAFISTWYRSYQESYTPLFIANFEGYKLTGLLLLAKANDGRIVGAGAGQAEYQVWLAMPNDENAFIAKALKFLDTQFPNIIIELKYIPGNAPMQWIVESAYFKDRCLVKRYKQPLLMIREDHFINELQKKNRREKVNRLKRLGNLQFERITNYTEFEAILDTLIVQFDFRKKAVYNTAIFQEEPSRKQFLLDLFKQKLLHATVLKLNEEVIASNVSVMGKSWMHLQGINSHAPTFAKYSPGILHLLMLGKELATEGIAVFDLTPGDDPYKGQLATDYKEAFHLIVYSPYQRHLSRLKLASAEKLKKLLLLFGYTPGRFKWQARKLKEQYTHVMKKRGLVPFKYLSAKILASNKECVYVIEKDQMMPTYDEAVININSLSDLLCIDPNDSILSSWAFIEEAMKRFEEGDICYSYCKNGQLQACAWVTGIKSSQEVATPPIVKGFYCHQKIKDQKQVIGSLIATIAAKDKMHNQIFVQVKKSDNSISRTLEALGFKQTDSVKCDN